MNENSCPECKSTNTKIYDMNAHVIDQRLYCYACGGTFYKADQSPPPRNHIDRVHSHRGELVAIIISDWTAERGIEFFTEPEHTLQLGVMRHATGKRIEAHVHNPVPRVVTQTVEVLFVKKGRLRADFYDADLHDLTSRELRAGDWCMLLAGGHGFSVIEEAEIWECRSGPYLGKEVEKTYASAKS